MKKTGKALSLFLAVILAVTSTKDIVFALDGVWHNPYGMDDLYTTDDTERYPKDPIAGEKVYIKGTTWPIEWGQSVWVGYKKNGEWQKDVGTDRTILSGIHAYYEPEELVGKTLVAITNLPPRAMMGIESCGMLLSAIHNEEGEERLNLFMGDNRIPAGAKLY